MEIASLATLFFAALVLMIKPGPYMMALISLCSEGKWRSALSFWLGYASVAMVLYYVLLSTLALLPQGIGLIFIFLKSIAALIFISMGLRSLQDTIKDYTQSAKILQKKADQDTALASLAAGGFLCISSPYELVWILAVVPSLVGQTVFTVTDITWIFGICIGANILVQSTYCFPLLLLHKSIPSHILKKIKLGSAAALILIGLYIFVTIFTRADLLQTNLLSS